MCHTGSPVAWRWLEDDCGGLCRKWTHSGKVPSNLSLCCSEWPPALLPDEINYQFPQSDRSLSGDGERPERLMPAKSPSKQHQGTINYSIWRRREWQAATWDVFNEMQALVTLTHTHWGCQDIEPERPRKPPIAASQTGCTNQPWAILYVWLCIYLCLRVWLHACLICMFMHLYS